MQLRCWFSVVLVDLLFLRPVQETSKPIGYRTDIAWRGLEFRQDRAFRGVFALLPRLGQLQGFAQGRRVSWSLLHSSLEQLIGGPGLGLLFPPLARVRTLAADQSMATGSQPRKTPRFFSTLT